MKRVIGKCGNCGGKVSVPNIWHGVNPPEPSCESCGATPQTELVKTIPMNPTEQMAEEMLANEKKDAVITALNNLHSDTSVSLDETLGYLEEVLEITSDLIDVVNADIEMNA